MIASFLNSWKNTLGFEGSGLGKSSLSKRFHRPGVCQRCSKFGLFVKMIFSNYVVQVPSGTLAKEKALIPLLGPVIATDIEGDFKIDQTSTY